MGHDATKVQLGTSQSTVRDVDNRAGTIAAGLIVRLKSDGTLSSASADGNPIGISLGADMSGIGRTAIARTGLRIPVRCTASFTPTLGAAVSISDTTGKAITAGAGATVMNAVYSSPKLTAYEEDGTLFADGAVYIDFPGGL